MRRFLSLKPDVFLQMLEDGGMMLGPKSASCQSVFDPNDPTCFSIVRLGYPLHEEVWKAILRNLGISEDEFQKLHDAWRPRS